MNKNASFLHSINVRALLTIDRVCCVQAVGGDAVQAGARVPAVQDVQAPHRQVAAAAAHPPADLSLRSEKIRKSKLLSREAAGAVLDPDPGKQGARLARDAAVVYK